MIDPMDPVIDADTLEALKYADERCANPSAALALDDASEGDVSDALEEAYDEPGEQDESDGYDDSDEYDDSGEYDESGDDDNEADGDDALDVYDEESDIQ